MPETSTSVTSTSRRAGQLAPPLRQDHSAAEDRHQDQDGEKQARDHDAGIVTAGPGPVNAASARAPREALRERCASPPRDRRASARAS
jgi:hypothetical protein